MLGGDSVGIKGWVQSKGGWTGLDWTGMGWDGRGWASLAQAKCCEPVGTNWRVCLLTGRGDVSCCLGQSRGT